MEIKLIITNARHKSSVFLSNKFKVATLEETIKLAEQQGVNGVCVVSGKYGQYIRSLPDSTLDNNIDSKSVTAADVLDFANKNRIFSSTNAISKYSALYNASISESGKPFITTYDGYKAFQVQVRDIIKLYKNIFLETGKKFNVDSNLLAAIAIDEITRLAAFEGFQDKLFLELIGRNVSVGIAQIKLETANGLIKTGYYNPNPSDAKLPIKGTLSNKDCEYLFKYVIEPKHNIAFEAARINDLINQWSKHVDISGMSDILGTLYHQKNKTPHDKPQPNERGVQIANEFYNYAKKWLK